MINNRERFRNIVVSITGESDTIDSALSKLKMYEVMLDPGEWSEEEESIYVKAANDIINILRYVYDQEVSGQRNKDYITNLLSNISPTTDEWWMLYDNSLQFMIPDMHICSIHGVLIQMYCDFMHANIISKEEQKQEDIFDMIEKEIIEEKDCLRQDITPVKFLQLLDGLQVKGRTNDEFLCKVKEKGIILSEEYRGIGDILKLHKTLSVIMDLLYEEYFDTKDTKRKSGIKRLANKLVIDNMYWWHLYDSTYLDAGIIGEKCMSDIHSALTVLYMSSGIDQLLGLFH